MKNKNERDERAIEWTGKTKEVKGLDRIYIMYEGFIKDKGPEYNRRIWKTR